MGSDLHLHNRWLLSGWSEYQFRAIAEHAESNETLRTVFGHEYFARSSQADLSILAPEDLLIFVRLGSRLTTFSDAAAPDWQSNFERVMSYVADWLGSDPLRELHVRIADTAPAALSADEAGTQRVVFTMAKLRELDAAGLGGQIETDEVLAQKTWLLLGPGPCVFAPDRSAKVELVKGQGLDLSRADFNAGDPWGLEGRLVHLLNHYSDVALASLRDLGTGVRSSAPPLLLELAELAADAVSSRSYLVLDYA